MVGPSLPNCVPWPQIDVPLRHSGALLNFEGGVCVCVCARCPHSKPSLLFTRYGLHTETIQAYVFTHTWTNLPFLFASSKKL